MNAAWKEKWVRALRSNTYAQIHEKLRRGPRGMCCLGVLCDVVDPEGWREFTDATGTVRQFHGSDQYEPPRRVRDQTGLPMEAVNTLVEMNDSEGKTFTEIADWIEENL